MPIQQKSSEPCDSLFQHQTYCLMQTCSAVLRHTRLVSFCTLGTCAACVQNQHEPRDDRFQEYKHLPGVSLVYIQAVGGSCTLGTHACKLWNDYICCVVDKPLNCLQAAHLTANFGAKTTTSICRSVLRYAHLWQLEKCWRAGPACSSSLASQGTHCGQSELHRSLQTLYWWAQLQLTAAMSFSPATSQLPLASSYISSFNACENGYAMSYQTKGNLGTPPSFALYNI